MLFLAALFAFVVDSCRGWCFAFLLQCVDFNYIVTCILGNTDPSTSEKETELQTLLLSHRFSGLSVEWEAYVMFKSIHTTTNMTLTSLERLHWKLLLNMCLFYSTYACTCSTALDIPRWMDSAWIKCYGGVCTVWIPCLHFQQLATHRM